MLSIVDANSRLTTTLLGGRGFSFSRVSCFSLSLLMYTQMHSKDISTESCKQEDAESSRLIGKVWGVLQRIEWYENSLS